MSEVRKIVLVPSSSKFSATAGNIVNTIKMCQDMHTLPNAGGLYDQDSLFVYFLKNYLIWSEQRSELDRRKTNVNANIGRSPSNTGRH